MQVVGSASDISQASLIAKYAGVVSMQQNASPEILSSPIFGLQRGEARLDLGHGLSARRKDRAIAPHSGRADACCSSH